MGILKSYDVSPYWQACHRTQGPLRCGNGCTCTEKGAQPGPGAAVWVAHSGPIYSRFLRPAVLDSFLALPHAGTSLSNVPLCPCLNAASPVQSSSCEWSHCCAMCSLGHQSLGVSEDIPSGPCPGVSSGPSGADSPQRCFRITSSPPTAFHLHDTTQHSRA